MSLKCMCAACGTEYVVVTDSPTPAKQGHFLVCPQCQKIESSVSFRPVADVWVADTRCQASQASDRVLCDRCSLQWDAGDPEPPACALRTSGVKNGNPKDIVAGGRVPLWLLSTGAKIAWALAQFAGVCKYGAWNWRADGARFSTYLSAMERHIEGLKNGEDFDPVDGTRHEGNIMACCAILIDASAAGKLIDDRPPRLDHRPALAEGEALMVKLAEQYKDKTPKHWTISDTLP